MVADVARKLRKCYGGGYENAELKVEVFMRICEG
jgi:hypothetical protein